MTIRPSALWTFGCALAAAAAALPATASQSIYRTTLSGAAESPANASPGTGVATVTFDLDAFTMRVETTFSGLLGTTTASHIHCCTTAPTAGTAGVATVLPSFTAFPLGVTAGSYDRTFDMLLAGSWNGAFITSHGGTPASAFSAMVAGADAGQAYLNIHTSSFGGGEIRGFLVAAAVPEPQTYALMAAGLGVLGLVARRRRAG